MESFHSILSTAIAREHFWSFQQLEARLAVFYDKYNNERVHSAIAYLPPNLFLEAWQKQLVEMKKGKKPIFRLKIPRYKLSGNLMPEGESRSGTRWLDAASGQEKPSRFAEKVSGAVTSQPSV